MMYSETELKDIEDDVEKIRNQWEIFHSELWNGTTGEIHQPPALTLACARLFMLTLDSTLTPEEAVHLGHDEEIQKVGNFAALMFAFGQRAQRDGLLSANMTQCYCTRVTDEDIENLIGK